MFLVGLDVLGASLQTGNVQEMVQYLNKVRPVRFRDAMVISKLGRRAIDRAMAIRPTGAFIPKQDTARKNVSGHINWHEKKIGELWVARHVATGTPPADEEYPHGDDLKKWVVNAFVEYNAALDAKTYADEKLSFWNEVKERVEEITREMEKPFGIEIPMWMWIVGGAIVVLTIGSVFIPIIRRAKG